jgi:PAP2 superfamily
VGNARLFALLNVTLADGYLGSWDAKYHYLFWRPVTAIHLADSDGNPLTAGDPTWTPRQLTYPIPDYDSGHAVQGGAAAEALKRFFEADDIAFDVCSFTLDSADQNCGGVAEVRRMYRSFSQAATENSLSRIYIGIHFRHAVEEGERHGRRIAAWVAKHFFESAR